MTLTATNDLHHTGHDLPILWTYRTSGGPVAEVTAHEMARARRTLCGMADCTCTGPHNATSADGTLYTLIVSQA